MTAHIPMPWLFSQIDQDPRSATGRKLRWGIVGTGSIANLVSEDLAQLKDAELYAVSSRSKETSAAFASARGFARSYGDDDGVPGYQHLINDPAVDVVYVATPHAQHFDIVRAALLAGKNVLCEKSFTINAREAAELVKLAREQQLFLMEALWSRFLPSIHRALHIAGSGELGEIQWVNADLGFPAPYSPTARIWAPAAGGGALLDLTVYPLLWAIGALGFPEAVSAVGTLNDDGVDSQNALTLSYANGALAQLTSSLLAHGPRTAIIAGSLGFLQTIGSINNPREISIRSGWDEPRVERFDVVGFGYTYELREVTRCIQQGLTESPVMPLEHSVQTMRLFDGVRSQLGVRYPNDAR